MLAAEAWNRTQLLYADSEEQACWSLTGPQARAHAGSGIRYGGNSEREGARFATNYSSTVTRRTSAAPSTATRAR